MNEQANGEAIAECFGDVVKVTSGVWACSCGFVLANTRTAALDRRARHLLISLATHDELVARRRGHASSETVPDFGPERKLGSAPCPNCNLFARVIVAGHYTYPDGEWSYTVDCKKCGRPPTAGVRLTEEE